MEVAMEMVNRQLLNEAREVQDSQMPMLKGGTGVAEREGVI